MTRGRPGRGGRHRRRAEFVASDEPKREAGAAEALGTSVAVASRLLDLARLGSKGKGGRSKGRSGGALARAFVGRATRRGVALAGACARFAVAGLVAEAEREMSARRPPAARAGAEHGRCYVPPVPLPPRARRLAAPLAFALALGACGGAARWEGCGCRSRTTPPARRWPTSAWPRAARGPSPTWRPMARAWRRARGRRGRDRGGRRRRGQVERERRSARGGRGGAGEPARARRGARAYRRRARAGARQGLADAGGGSSSGGKGKGKPWVD